MKINLGAKMTGFFGKGMKIFSKEKRRRGVTLVELMTVMAILAVSVSMFYNVWFSNWRTFDHHTAIADLWFDANEISEAMAMDGRAAKVITVSADQKVVDFENSLGNTIATYQITSMGDFIITEGGTMRTVTQQMDFANSIFIQQGRGMKAELSLVDTEVLGDDVAISFRTEVFPRN